MAGLSRLTARLFLVVTVIMIIMITQVSAEVTDRQVIIDALKNTAVNYWKMRMEQDYDATYKMEDKAALPSFKDYVPKAQAIKKLNIRSHTIKDIIVDGTSGTVTIEFKVLMPAVSKPFTQFIEDKWVYKNEKWLHILPPQ